MSLRSWGEPPWRRSSFDAIASLPDACDVAIIGGGLTGASAAWHLASRGVKAVLFEADRIASGASGRTGGLVLEGLAYGPRPGADDCVPQLRRLVDELALDCGLYLPGCWEIVHETLDGRLLPWRDAGSAISILNTVPGGIVEPAALTLGLAAAARRAGAKLFEHAPVKRINRGRSPIVEVAGRRVSCAQVVVALNGWTAALIPIPEMVSALTYALVTAPLEQTTLKALGLAERIPFYTADTPYLWGRVCDDGAIVFGAGLTYGSPAEMEATAITQTEPQAILDGLEKRIRGLHPALARVPITSRWAGPIAFRKGAIPVLARLPEAPNVLVAAAYAGHGVAFSVHAGRLMAAAIIDNATLPPWGAIARDANQS